MPSQGVDTALSKTGRKQRRSGLFATFGCVVVTACCLAAASIAPVASAKLTGHDDPTPSTPGIDCVDGPGGQTNCSHTTPWSFGPGANPHYKIRAWNEKQQFLIRVSCVQTNTNPYNRFDGSGQYGPIDYDPTPANNCIGPNTRVDSHFLHFHPATDADPLPPNSSRQAQGCVRFDGAIFGVQTWKPSLDASESGTNALWAEGFSTIYPTGETNRGLEPPDSPGSNTDAISINNNDGHRLCMDARWFGIHDEIRVITAGLGSVSLSPVGGQYYVGSNPVDTQICIGATVVRSTFGPWGGEAAPGEYLQMNVNGDNPRAVGPGPTTDSNGYVTRCYTGTVAGIDSIDVFADSSSDDGTSDGPDGQWDEGGHAATDKREAGTQAQTTWTRRSTSTSVNCPGTPSLGSSTLCTITVRDTEPAGATSDPTGSVIPQALGGGSFSSSTCGTLQATGTTGTRTCTVTYHPTSQPCGVRGDYQGDAKHLPSQGSTTITCGGRLVVQKVTQPVVDAQDFDFTTGGGLSPGTFTLDSDPASGSVPGSISIPDINPGNGSLPGGKYKVAETLPGDGWWDPQQSDPQCSNNSPASAIDVQPGQIITCTFTNIKRGTVVVKKRAITTDGDGQDFDFTTAGGLTPPTFQLDDDSASALPSVQTIDRVRPGHGSLAGGAYSAEEIRPANGWWDLTGLTCDDGGSASPSSASVSTQTATLGVDPGETVTCTFTNTKRGTVVVRKRVVSVNEESQAFDFTAAGGLSPAGFQLDDNSDASLSNTETFDRILPSGGSLPGGTYSAQETLPGDGWWDLTGVTCDDGSSDQPSTGSTSSLTATYDVEPGETVTCTFENTKRAALIVDKQILPGDTGDQRFYFTHMPCGDSYYYDYIEGQYYYSSNLLAGQNRQCDRLIHGAYTIHESDPGPAFKLKTISCDDEPSPTPSTSIVDPFPGFGGSVGSATYQLDPGETVNCTFTNEDQRGVIVLDKQVAPGGYSDAYTKQFGFHGSGSSPYGISFNCSNNGSPFTVYDANSYGTYDTANLTHGQNFRCDLLLPGDYTIQESDHRPDFLLTDIQCDDGLSTTPSSGDIENRMATFHLDPRETIDCTVTNDDQRGRIGFDKTVEPGGYSDAYTKQFGFHGRGSPYGISFNCSNNGSPFTVYDANAYGIIDTANLTHGQSVDCDRLWPGAYTIQESDYWPDFKLTGLSCDDGASPTRSITDPFARTMTFNVEPHENVNCHVTNKDQRGKIILKKEVAPGGYSDAYTKQFGFHGRGSPYDISFNCSNDGSPFTVYDANSYGIYDTANLSDGQSFACEKLPPGPYNIQESDYGPDFKLTDLTCDDGASTTPSTVDVANRTATFEVDPGEIVTCTVTNTDDRGKIIVEKDAIPNGGQAFDFSTSGGLYPQSFQLDDDGNDNNGLSSRQEFTALQPGSGYSVAESVPAGWDQTSAICSDGSSPANIDLSAGETVTCTFKNTKRAKIVVVKDALPDDAQDFSFTAGGGLTPTSFQLDDDGDNYNGLSNSQEFDNLQPGSGYNVAEGTAPSGWDKGSATCNDNSPITNISLSAGETVTCTFVNKKRGTIVIKKDAYPDETTDFSFTTTGGLTPSSFLLDDDGGQDATLSDTRTFTNVIAKNGYTVTEAANVDFAIGAACDDGASATPSFGNIPTRGATINLDPGETVTCTFANTGVYARPGGGSPLVVSLVPSFGQCTAANSTHIGPLNGPSCTSPQLTSGSLTTSTVGRGRGTVRLDTLVGNAATPADEANVKIAVDLTDVIRRSDGGDYAGKVILALALRVTDRSNLPVNEGSGTLRDTLLSAPIDCAATSDPITGGKCTLATTAKALVPGIAVEQHRSIWAIRDVSILDAGPDGSVTPSQGSCPYTCGSGDETVFAVPGIFAP